MKELYEVYLECVDREILMYDSFVLFISENNREIVEYKVNGVLLGFAIVEDNKILFLGVKKSYRNRENVGLLLDMVEVKILSKGYNKIILNSVIIPIGKHDFAFFEEIGYEDLFINSDYLFDKDNLVNKNASGYDFIIDDYQLVKDSLLDIDLKKISNLNFKDKLLVCVKDGSLVGYCQCMIRTFKELGELGIIKNMCVLPEYYDLAIEELLISKVVELFNLKKVLLYSYDNSKFREHNMRSLYLEHIMAVRFI